MVTFYVFVCHRCISVDFVKGGQSTNYQAWRKLLDLWTSIDGPVPVTGSADVKLKLFLHLTKVNHFGINCIHF